MSGKRAESDRRVGLAKRGQADVWDRLANMIGRDGERVEVRCLALIGRHSRRRVAFDVLDRAKTLLRREFQVLGRDVVLEIYEGRAVSRQHRTRADLPREWLPEFSSAGRSGVVARLPMAAIAAAACDAPSFSDGGHSKCAAAGARRPLAWTAETREERLLILMPGELAAGLGEEMYRRCPTATHEQKVTGDFLGSAIARPSATRADFHARNPQSTCRASTVAPDMIRILAGRTRGVDERPLWAMPEIHDRSHLDASVWSASAAS